MEALKGVTTANGMNAGAAAAGMFAAGIVGNTGTRQGYSANVVDGGVALLGLVVVGMTSGSLRYAGIGMTAASIFRLANRNLLAAA